MKVGLLHPGAMGTSIGAAAKSNGAEVFWVGAQRGPATAARAATQGFSDAGTLHELADRVELIVSVCPPHAAESVAEAVAGTGFKGTYLDANAIAPQRARAIGQSLERCGIDFIDGGIIGPPAWAPARTWLHMSGPRATAYLETFTAGPLTATDLGDEVGRASALKMSFAAYTKGMTALLCGILATADAHGVRAELCRQWAEMGMGLDEKAPREARNVTAKAWRFVGEMEEIAATFEAAGLPGGFHQAAAELYARLADFKDADPRPDLDAVLAALAGRRRDAAA